jgi:hypothetical protein
MLDQLAPEFSHAIIACARDDNGWAILMRNVSEGLLPWDRQIDAFANEHILRSLACQHARFWNAPELKQPELGLCSLTDLINTTAPSPHSKERYTIGWGLLSEVFRPDHAAILRGLIVDPQPLYKALARYPNTLVHGDFKSTNLAWLTSPQPQVVALDWQLAGVGVPAMDLAWYFGAGMSLPAPPELCIERYHQHLACMLGNRFDECQWQPMLELGMLVTIVRNCCSIAWTSTHEKRQIRRDNVQMKLPMWYDWIRAGVKRL